MGSQPHAQPREWTAEKAALHEKKKITQFQREREEERALEQLEKLQETTGRKPAVKHKLAWMYQTPSDENALMDESREAYLLGRKRVDKLLRVSDEDINNSLGGHNRVAKRNSARDMATQLSQDPLLAILKRRQQQVLSQAKQEQCFTYMRRSLRKDDDARRDSNSRKHDGDPRQRYLSPREKPRLSFRPLDYHPTSSTQAQAP
jgi:hypothetical protein